MPKIGKFFLTSSLIIPIAYLPVAAGSPGPLDRKIPFGFNFSISFVFVLHELQLLCSQGQKNILRYFF